MLILQPVYIYQELNNYNGTLDSIDFFEWVEKKHKKTGTSVIIDCDFAIYQITKRTIESDSAIKSSITPLDDFGIRENNHGKSVYYSRDFSKDVVNGVTDAELEIISNYKLLKSISNFDARNSMSSVISSFSKEQLEGFNNDGIRISSFRGKQAALVNNLLMSLCLNGSISLYDNFKSKVDFLKQDNVRLSVSEDGGMLKFFLKDGKSTGRLAGFSKRIDLKYCTSDSGDKTLGSVFNPSSNFEICPEIKSRSICDLNNFYITDDNLKYSANILLFSYNKIKPGTVYSIESNKRNSDEHYIAKELASLVPSDLYQTFSKNTDTRRSDIQRSKDIVGSILAKEIEKIKATGVREVPISSLGFKLKNLLNCLIVYDLANQIYSTSQSLPLALKHIDDLSIVGSDAQLGGAPARQVAFQMTMRDGKIVKLVGHTYLGR